MTATDYGYAHPEGDALVSGGDNAITQNAERSAELFDQFRFPRATSSEIDLDNYTTPGGYNFGAPFPTGYVNVPPDFTTASVLLVVRGSTTTWGIQMLWQIGDDPKFAWRTAQNTSTWGSWRAAGSDRGLVPNGTNVDTMRGSQWAGTWVINSSNGPSLTGTLPEGLTSWTPGQIQVIGSDPRSTNLSTIVYTPYTQVGARPLMYLVRTINRYQETGAAAWSDWSDLARGGSGPSDLPVNSLALGSRDMRMQMFLDEYPLVSTGGKGCVVFRYDHGLTNFKDVLYPLHQQYALGAYIAMNSRNWGIGENSGATQAEAAAWSGIEWGNHTTDHKDQTGIADIYDSIVNGRIELEDQLGTTIHGFTVPGVTEYDKFDGFGVGYPNGFSNSYAGSLILQHHAISSGVIGPQQRPLDGQIRIGGRHIGWENSDLATIKGHIDDAIANQTALTLMCHPRTMGITGYWTADLADQVLSYVREQIDAGNLADLSYYQSHHATTAAL